MKGLILICALYLMHVVKPSQSKEALYGRRIKAIKDSEKNNSKEIIKHNESVHSFKYVLPPLELIRDEPANINDNHPPTHHRNRIFDIPPSSGPPDGRSSHQRNPKSQIYTPRSRHHKSNDLPVYKDDPKDHLKALIPSYNAIQSASGAIKILAPIRSYARPVLPEEHHPKTRIDSYHYDGYGHGVPGFAGKEYPVHNTIPPTDFSCKKTKYPGFYADVETGCQVWHYCQLDGRHDRFLCPKGTLFNQATRVCDWWYNVQCQASGLFFDVNSDLYRAYPVNVQPHFYEPPPHQPHQQHYTRPEPSIYSADLNRQPLNYHKDINPYVEDGPILYAESKIEPQKISTRLRRVKIKSSKIGADSSSSAPKPVNSNS